MKNLISIICPVFNTKSYLYDCILSVVNQTDGLWELILVDDGSTDGSGHICDTFSAKDERIKVVHKQNAGQMKARVDGILEAKGEYILFLDSDDMLEHTAIKSIRSSIINYNYPDCILFNAKYYSANKNAKSLPFIKECALFDNNKDIVEQTFGSQMFGYLWMYCFNKIFLLNAIKTDNKFLNIRYTEDGAFIYRVISKLNSLNTVTDCLYKYRDNGGSITHNLTDKDREDRFLVFDYIYSNIFYKHEDFVLSNENAIKVSWALFSLLEHTSGKKVFVSRFKTIRQSVLFKKICKGVKTKNKQFNFYRFLIKLNMRSAFYKYSHK